MQIVFWDLWYYNSQFAWENLTFGAFALVSKSENLDTLEDIIFMIDAKPIPTYLQVHIMDFLMKTVKTKEKKIEWN